MFDKHSTVFIQRNANKTIRLVEDNLIIFGNFFKKLKALSWENF